MAATTATATTSTTSGPPVVRADDNKLATVGLRARGPARSGPRRARSSAKGGQRSSPVLLVVLGVVVLAAIIRFAIPSLVGGGGTTAFKPVLVPRHLVKRAPAPAPNGGGGVVVSRPSRDPFSAPPGYADH